MPIHIHTKLLGEIFDLDVKVHLGGVLMKFSILYYYIFAVILILINININ